MVVRRPARGGARAPRAVGAGPRRLRLLDAGCGTGFNLVALARYGATLGIDLSQDAIRILPRARRARGARLGAAPAVPRRGVRRRDVVRRDLPRLGRGRPRRGRRDGARAAAGRRAAGARAGARGAARRARRRGAHAAALHARRARGAARERRARVSSARPTATRCCSRCSSPAARSTGCSGARAPTSASCRPPLERLFRGLMGVEAWCVRRGLSFPLGASVVALARKPPLTIVSAADRVPLTGPKA